MVALIVVGLLIILFEGQDKYKETRSVYRKSVLINLIKWNALSGDAEVFRTWQSKIMLMGVGLFSIIT